MSVAVELALAVVIVGVTAALVAEPPAQAQPSAETAPVSRDVFVHPYQADARAAPAWTEVGQRETFDRHGRMHWMTR